MKAHATHRGQAPEVDEGDAPDLAALLRRELRPTPGRLGDSVRIVVVVLVVVAILETFRIPEIAVSAYIVLFLSAREAASPVRTALAAGIAVVLAIFTTIAVFMLSLSLSSAIGRTHRHLAQAKVRDDDRALKAKVESRRCVLRDPLGWVRRILPRLRAYDRRDLSNGRAVKRGRMSTASPARPQERLQSCQAERAVLTEINESYQGLEYDLSRRRCDVDDAFWKER